MTMRIPVLFDDVDHPEDVCLTSSGRLVFGGERGQVYLGDPASGDLRKIATTGGRCLGIAVDGADDVYVCDPRRAAIVGVPATGGRPVVVGTGSPDHALRHPNSIAFGPDGIAWLSDSGSWGDDDGALLRLAPDGGMTLASREFPAFTNGIAVSPDGDHLYVIESRFGLSRCAIRDGVLGEREEIARLDGFVPDGVAFCADGSVVVACFQPNAILHVARSGEVSELLRDDQGVGLTMPTNVAFFGPELASLAIANLGGRSVTRVEPGLVGAPLHRPVTTLLSESATT